MAQSWKGSKPRKLPYAIFVSLLSVIIFFVIMVHDVVEKNRSKRDLCDWGYFPCSQATRMCLKREKWCDGNFDCPDLSDEKFICSPGEVSVIKRYSILSRLVDTKNRKEELSAIRDTKYYSEYNETVLERNITKLLESLYPHAYLPKNTSTEIIVSLLQRHNSLEKKAGFKFKIFDVFTEGNEINKPEQQNTSGIEQKAKKHSVFSELHANNDVKIRTGPLNIERTKASCFGNCTCTENDKVVCKDSTSFKTSLENDLSTYRKLLASNMHLTDLQKKFPKSCSNIQVLSVVNSSLSHISDGVFKHLSSLALLNLKGNRLRVVRSNMFRELENLIVLKLTGNLISVLEEGSFTMLTSLKMLILDYNQLTDISSDVFPQSIISINIRNNNLKKIRKSPFSLKSKLSFLSLKNNRIETIEDGAFKETAISDLNLSNNSLTIFSKNVFASTKFSPLLDLNLGYNPLINLEDSLHPFEFLASLNLSGISFKNLKTAWFKELHDLKMIHFERFEMCRYTPRVTVCYPNTDGISTLENLLDNNVLIYCIWIIAFITLVGNLSVMLCRGSFREDKNIHSLFIENLAGADFMLGVYLLLIACHDCMYRDNYNAHATNWMDGWTCQATGFIALMALEVSVLIITCMSVECCLTVSFPFKPRLMDKRKATIALGFLWFFGVTLAAIPIIFSSYFGAFYGNNGLCLPLHIHDPFTEGWQYSMFIFIGVNAVCIITIVVCYSVILFSFRKTRSNVYNVDSYDCRRKWKTNRKIHFMDKRIFCIVLTNFSCWIPIVVFKIIALNSVKISDMFYAWLAVFVVPINSSLNPVIYSLTTLNFRKKFLNYLKPTQTTKKFREFLHLLYIHMQGCKPLKLPRKELTPKNFFLLTNIFHKLKLQASDNSEVFENSKNQTFLKALKRGKMKNQVSDLDGIE